MRVRWRVGRGDRKPGRFTGKEPVYRITGARQSLADDVRARQRRYVVSMLIRTASVIATVLLWNISRPLAIGTLAIGALLPYVAVVIANAGRENPPSPPPTMLRESHRPALPAEPDAKRPERPPDDPEDTGHRPD